MFFFEKKNQKTFGRCRGPPPSIYPKIQKFFASFFQKRRPCLPPGAPSWRSARAGLQRPAVARFAAQKLCQDIMAILSFRSACLLLPLAMAACGGGDSSVKPVSGAAYADPSLPPPATASVAKANKQQEADAGLVVNKYLWRGALDTLGFMPLASADPFGGVIVTDWYSPPTTAGERFKATVYVLGRQLRSDGVKVSLFRQVRDGGEWADAPVNPATATDIENKILARARELRARAA
jgi:hypothetical protein